MYLLCDQFICFRPDWREPIYFYLTAQEENAVPSLFVLPTNARTYCLIYDYYLLTLIMPAPYFCILKFSFTLQLWALNVKLGARSPRMYPTQKRLAME